MSNDTGCARAGIAVRSSRAGIVRIALKYEGVLWQGWLVGKVSSLAIGKVGTLAFGKIGSLAFGKVGFWQGWQLVTSYW
jgi:hypothetical protein